MSIGRVQWRMAKGGTAGKEGEMEEVGLKRREGERERRREGGREGGRKKRHAM